MAVGTLELDRDGDGIFEVTIEPNGDAKITICHIPPGNPGNAQSINIGLSALQAHQKHGDYEGACDGREVQSGAGTKNKKNLKKK